VAVDEALENKLDQIASELESAFKEKKNVDVEIERRGLDRLDIKFADPAQVATAEDDVLGDRPDSTWSGSTPRTRSTASSTSRCIEQRLAENRSGAVSQALDTVRRRIDAMGIAEPNIYPKNRQIVIELPGLSDTTTEIKAARKDLISPAAPDPRGRRGRPRSASARAPRSRRPSS
jgi:preprotein translocase subunit SecD